ncbi:hypothetical protein EOM71_00700, partial [Candidatus Falkowbacteria bacterium]|nr:hypothetical protein [Candidatus Falkowbacteria bacterium]
MLNLENYSDKKIALLGLGSENEALLFWLAGQEVSLNITIYDRRPEEALIEKRERIVRLTGELTISWRLGDQSQDTL